MSGGEVIFLTHGEVEIDPTVPVPDWGLSAEGQRRHRAFADDAALTGVRAIFSSTERKAVEAAAPAAARLDLPHRQHEDLGENDRSATGYLPPDQFWPMVDRFFGAPDISAEGRETARDAQARITRAVGAVVDAAPEGDVLIVAHGGVGALLRQHLLGTGISRTEGQPHKGGGCWFRFSRAMDGAPSDWRAI